MSTIVNNAYFEQLRSAACTMQALTDFATSIGCVVFEDMIIVETAEQEAALKKWWETRHEPS